jgi:hypothetical protein
MSFLKKVEVFPVNCHHPTFNKENSYTTYLTVLENGKINPENSVFCCFRVVIMIFPQSDDATSVFKILKTHWSKM